MTIVRIPFVALAATLALAACEDSAPQSGGAPAQTASAPAMSTGAKAVYDGMMADTAKMKQACQGGRSGVTAYATKVASQLISQGNSSIKPEADGPIAGRAAGQRCASLMGG